jgi:hypothetical protein
MEPDGNDVKTEAEDADEIRYQATASEDIEDFMCVVVTAICKVCKSVILLKLVTSFKSPINPITNPNPVYSH